MIKVQSEDFDQQVEYDRLRKDPSVGAVVTFSGLVRDINQGEQVSCLTLEHYPGMTEKALRDIAHKAEQRWQIIDLAIIHRIGELKPADQIVLVAVLSAHRADAFAACEFIMDYLKTDAPFWKKEVSDQGSNWVEAKKSDQITKNKWET